MVDRASSSGRKAFTAAGAFALFLLMPGVALAAPLPPGGTFTDDNGKVHQGFIEALAAEGLTRGCNPPLNTKYCPSLAVTRGEMAAFLVRALGLIDDGGGNTFTDVTGSTFEGDIAKLAAAGITRGCNPPANDRFCPERPVTRGEIAAFLVRALGLTGDGGGNSFVDDNGSVFEAEIEKLATAGITRGCNPPANDRFCPDDSIRRDQMASFLGQALNLEPITPTMPDLAELCGPASTWVDDIFEDLDGDGLDEWFYVEADEDTQEVLFELRTQTGNSGLWEPVYAESFSAICRVNGAEIWLGDLTGDGKRELVTCAGRCGANDFNVNARVLSNHGTSWELVWRSNRRGLDDGIVSGQLGSLVVTERREFAGQCAWSEHSIYDWDGSDFTFASMTRQIHLNDSDSCDSMFP
jgi:hypothetical protein